MPRITESTGDIFAAPQNSVLIHACNCRGVWGGGVALEFKKRYPQAFEVYHQECHTPSSEFHQKSLLGTALLIPPQDDDLATSADEGHWIACLFTSLDYGRKVSPELVILESTKKAMADLQKKMRFWKAKGQEFGDLWAVRINSGKFGVPWDRTKRILEQCGMDVKVVAPEGEVAEVKQVGKQDSKETAYTDKPADVAGQANLLDSGNEGSMTEKTSKDTAKVSKKRKERKELSPGHELQPSDKIFKKRKERKESSAGHELQPSDKIPEELVKSSKRRKEKKHDSGTTESRSKEKAKGKMSKGSLELR